MNLKFPVDAPKQKVLKTLQQLGFITVREGNHISMLRKNIDGTSTPLTLPNHKIIKSSTLRGCFEMLFGRHFDRLSVTHAGGSV